MKKHKHRNCLSKTALKETGIIPKDLSNEYEIKPDGWRKKNESK
jgi:hypothetical protein